MPLIEWNDELSVGIDEIDEQHKKWISIINDLHTSLMEETSLDTLEKTINEVEEYTFFHFAEEEKLMGNVGYPDLSRHSRIHFSFRQEIIRVRSSILSGEVVLRTQVMSILKSWLLDHIMKEDMQYGDFIKEKCSKEKKV
ncbi:MAG: bacteriohemerythrin [Deltaproteobacteria bacterium]|nr:bacteriohemerythrin [Deltaproteobacteria bacterium]